MYREIQTALEAMLKGRAARFETLEQDGKSLLLLFTDKEVAGFGIVGENPIPDFEKLYGIFKNANGRNRESWAGFNLSFVLCRQPSSSGFDEFFNSISTDVYFCRKYVVRVGNALWSDLASLHFVPLDHGSVPVPKRPKSAQGVLMDLGVPSELASSIVLAHKKGDDRLIAECLEKKFGAPIIRHANSAKDSAARSEPLRAHQPIRLTSLTLENFRCYLGRHTFDLDADIVVLYGPNGLGKTSFFDAIDFLATGGSGRFSTRSDAFKHSAKHLDAVDESCSVTATVSEDGKQHQYTRRLHTNSKCSIDNIESDRFETLLRLTGDTGEYSEKRVEALVNLFRATHLFGQDYQSLAPQFSVESRLSLDTVSRMLAFQDYVRGIRKMEGLKRVLDSRSGTVDTSFESKVSELRELEGQLAQLEVPLAESSNIPDQNALIKDMGTRLSRESGLKFTVPGAKPKDTLRSWRAALEGAATDQNNELDRILALLRDFPAHEKARKELAASSQRQEMHRKNIATQKELLKNLNRDMGQAKGRSEKLSRSEQSLLKTQENLGWQVSAKEKLDRAALLLGKLIEKGKQLSAKQEDAQNKFTKLNSVQEDFRVKASSAASNAEVLGEGIHLCTELIALAPDWEKGRVRLGVISEKLPTEKEKKKALAGELIVQRKKLAEVQAEHVSLSAEVTKRQDSTQELRLLLDSLEKYVTGSSCPTCGQQFGSKADLIDRIGKQKKTFGKDFEETATALKAVEKQVQELKKEIADIDLQVHGKQAVIDALDQEQINLKAQNDQFHALASDLKFTIPSADVLARLREQQKTLDTQRLAAERERQVNLDGEKKAAAALRDLGRSLESIQTDLAAVEDEIRQSKLDTQQLQAEASQRKLSLSSPIKEIRAALDGLTTELGALRADLVVAVRTEEEKSTVIEKIESQLETLDAGQEKLEETVAALQAEIEGFLERAAVIGEKKPASEDVLRGHRDAAKAKLKILNRFSEEVSRAEIVLDSLEQSALAVQMKKRLAELVGERESLSQEKGQLDAWSRYFSDLAKTLESIRDGSVNEYTKGYGPMASIIQKRLRSVYGFGDILLTAEKGEIAVEVQRAAQRFVPTDFFSESQKQILILSLFLTAAITQNWSGFSPLLLDDPVMHFDDLNAYSFLDLINSLAGSEHGKRQFIISTCDDRLFHLMRQKFSARGSNVMMYEFRSIGDTGPVKTTVQVPN